MAERASPQAAVAAAAGVHQNPPAAVQVPGDGEEWTFPVYVGHRRPLAPDDVLFEAGNEERGELGKQAVRSVAKDTPGQMAKEADLTGDLAAYLSHKFECSTCHAALPTAHLLSCHVSELHDSFFAAQAARRMRVYCCLVEGCGRKFCTIEERKQHLADHHRFPRNYNFDRIHLRRKKAQMRALPQYRKGHGRKGMDSEQPAEPGVAAAGGSGMEVEGDAQAGPGGANGAGAPAAPHDEMVAGLSRLSVAAHQAGGPSSVSFGRRSAGRMMPGRGRGRGAGRGGASQGGRCGEQQAGSAAPAEAATDGGDE